jgi:hypothetical protein
MLTKIQLRPGVNKENTRYSSENGWYDCDKIRFRQGTPEKVGGWVQISVNRFLGVCRSLWAWVTLGGQSLVGVGTNLKFYISNSGTYYDITPIRTNGSYTLGASPIATTSGSSTITVTDAGGGYSNGNFVTFYGATSVGGITLLGEYQLTLSTTANKYTVVASSAAAITIANPAVFTTQYKLANNVQVTLTTTGALPSPFVVGTTYYVVNTSGYTFQLSATSGGSAISTFASTQSGVHTVTAKASSTTTGGGSVVQAVYQIAIGPEYAVPITGWGASTWGSGYWGIGSTSSDPIRLWSQSNFGENLIFGPRGGAIYYWNAQFGYSETTVSISIANPAVITSTVSVVSGQAIMFSTDGSLPSTIKPGVLYYALSAGTVFNISTSVGGAAVDTSAGTQSGTQKIMSRALPLASLNGASAVPAQQNYLMVSDSSRFVFAFGATEFGSSVFNPMLIRWSDQGDPVNWTPGATVQAGFTYLSHGSQIITAVQSRQEILVLTDSSIYSLQFVGAPVVWAPQLVGDNTSIAGQNAAAYANGVTYWMGVDKFYKYDGRTQTLPCDLRQFVFENINKNQFDQVYAGTNEGFNEVWWFYCSGTSTTIDSYVIYNYAEPNGNGGIGVWYYGTMGRTAWLDSGIINYPIATTYEKNIVNHESGLDDNATGTPAPIEAYISSAEFDLDDGDRFGFVWRVLPDVKFSGSTATSPSVALTLKPMQNSGSGYNSPLSVGGNSNATVVRSATVPIETFTGQVYIRVRGRQMVMEYRSVDLGVQWQAGATRLDIRKDGRR